jgi:hypothetical protein
VGAAGDAGRERLRQRRLTRARHVLDEQVAAGEQAGQRELGLASLAEDHRLDVRDHRLGELRDGIGLLGVQ